MLQVNMTAGSAYAIVLDGYGGKFGQYQLDITAQQVHEPVCPMHSLSLNLACYTKQFWSPQQLQYSNRDKGVGLVSKRHDCTHCIVEQDQPAHVTVVTTFLVHCMALPKSCDAMCTHCETAEHLLHTGTGQQHCTSG